MFQGPDLVSCQALAHIRRKLAKEVTGESWEEGWREWGVITTRGWLRPHTEEGGTSLVT